MNDFSKWFAQQTKEDGNNKLFRNRKGMELAWSEAQKQQRKRCADAIKTLLQDDDPSYHDMQGLIYACLNATEEDDD